MPVFASLTGSSQKGGGYDVGSAQAVTTDPALTNVTGDNYELCSPLIGQQPTVLASDWLAQG